MLDEVVDALETYTVLPTREAYYATALWIVHTHVMEAFDFAPMLVVTSAVKGSGKTRVLDVVDSLVWSPERSVNITPAALVRLLNQDMPPTVIIDEADGVFGINAEGSETLRTTINTAFQRGQSVVRAGGHQYEQLKRYKVFGSICIAGIGHLPDTIEHRSVVLRMRRRLSIEEVKPFRRRDALALAPLKERIQAWSKSVEGKLYADGLELPVEDRAADTWEPLLMVARAAGDEWFKRGVAACLAFTEVSAGAMSEPERLLLDLRQIDREYSLDWYSTTELLGMLKDIPESEWDEIGLTGRKLALNLKDFGVEPGPNTQRTKRGYDARELRDVFDRYLTPEEDASDDSK